MLEIRELYDVPNNVVRKVKRVIPIDKISEYYRKFKNLTPEENLGYNVSQGMIIMYEWDREVAKWHKD